MIKYWEPSDYGYWEWTIRCITCNQPIACFVPQYLQLLADGYSIEQALNELHGL